MNSANEPANSRSTDTPNDSAAWPGAFTVGRFVLLIALLLLVEYPEVILGSHSFFNGDFGLFTYPVAQYTRESFWRGEVPLWNPLSNCGVPFLAQWNTTVCYPLSWLYTLLPLPWSLNYFCLGHLVIAGVGMYLLAHRWTGNRFAASVAGLAFGLNGLSFNCLMWTSNLAALSWMPLTVLCVERAWLEGGRFVCLGGIMAGLQMLAGAPEIIFLTWMLLGTLWLGQVCKRIVSFKAAASQLALTVLIVSGLAAVQLLPFLQLLSQSDRDPGRLNAAWSMPIWGWANFFVPLFRCARAILGTYYQMDQQWTSSYYVGIGVTVVALLAVCKIKTPRIRWLGVVAAMGLLLALGEGGYVYGIAKKIFPLFGVARYPIKFIVPTVFALPLLAAFGINWIQQQSQSDISPSRRSLVWSGMAALTIIAGIVVYSRLVPFPEEVWSVTAKNGGTRALFLVVALGGLFLLRKNAAASNRRWIGWAILLVLGFDALTHTPRQNPTVPNMAYGELAPEMSSVPRFGESRAMISPLMQAIMDNSAVPDPQVYYYGQRRSLNKNCNWLNDLPKVNGFVSLHLRREAAVEALVSNPTNTPTGLIDFLGVSQTSSRTTMFEWDARKSYLPLVTAGQRPVFSEANETLRGITAAEFDPRGVVYLPIEARGKISVTNSATAAIMSAQFTAQRIDFVVDATQPAMVVVAQAFYPCWYAYVDENPVQLWRANHAFQTVEVPAGKHTVKLVYRDRLFYAGAVISATTLLLCVFFYFRKINRTGPRLSCP